MGRGIPIRPLPACLPLPCLPCLPPCRSRRSSARKPPRRAGWLAELPLRLTPRRDPRLTRASAGIFERYRGPGTVTLNLEGTDCSLFATPVARLDASPTCLDLQLVLAIFHSLSLHLFLSVSLCLSLSPPLFLFRIEIL